MLKNAKAFLAYQKLGEFLSMVKPIKKTLFIHSPTLGSVLMVEKTIYKHSGEFTRYQLWKNLPKKMMYQTFCIIIDYLLHSGKIATDRKGTLGWIWNPEMARYYLKREDLAWKPNQK